MELSFNPVNVPTVWSLHFVARKCFDKLGTMLLKSESIIDPQHANIVWLNGRDMLRQFIVGCLTNSSQDSQDEMFTVGFDQALAAIPPIHALSVKHRFYE